MIVGEPECAIDSYRFLLQFDIVMSARRAVQPLEALRHS